MNAETDSATPVTPEAEPRTEAGKSLVAYVYGVALVANPRSAESVRDDVRERVAAVEAELAGGLDKLISAARACADYGASHPTAAAHGATWWLREAIAEYDRIVTHREPFERADAASSPVVAPALSKAARLGSQPSGGRGR